MEPGDESPLWGLDIFDEKCSDSKPLLPQKALKGRRNRAQGKRRREPLAPPWVSVSANPSPFPSNRLPFQRFEGRERGATGESHVLSFSKDSWHEA